MDAATGLMLVVAPGFTLRLMRVPAPDPASLVFVSWIGVFVLAVGCSYFLAPRRLSNSNERERLAVVWRFTTIARALVAAFVTWRVVTGGLPPAWLTVAATDAVIAAVQFQWLRGGLGEHDNA